MQGKNHMHALDEQLAASGRPRHSASKYDFVKVKVWVGENLAHYYVLSRFLISRMLTVTKIPQMKAVKIALEVKKYLVDNDFLDISQDHFEAILFNVMRARGFENDYVERYKMVTKFFQQRRPLIVLMCGVPCTGKSTLAQQLASRLNMPNVLQTDAIYELMRMSEDGPLQPTPLWEREDLSPGGLVREFLRECRIVRKGLDGSLFKCIGDGKSIIMEGMHLDPSLYLYEFARFGQAHLKGNTLYNGTPTQPNPASMSEKNGPSSDGEAAKANTDSHGLRVSARAVSADEQLMLRRGGRPRLPARRSASFMLSPSLADEHGRSWQMNPVLAHAAELQSHASAPISGELLRQPPIAGSGSREQPISAPRHRLPGDDSAASHAFLSTSPTMQWLQVASRTGGSELASKETASAAAAPQQSAAAGQRAPSANKPPLQSPRRGRLSEHVPAAGRIVPASPQQHQEQPAGTSEDSSGAGLEPQSTPSAGQEQEDACRASVEQGGVPSSVMAHASQAQHVSSNGRSRHDSAALTHAGSPQNPSGAGLPASSAAIAQQNGSGGLGVRCNAGLSSSLGRRSSVDDAPQQQEEEELKPGPVFVPIVLCMDDEDHELLVREWHACHVGPDRSDGKASSSTEEQARSTLERLRVLQSHLCSYVQRSVPVVKVDLANFSDTLDRLHDYLLLCIQMAMEQDEADVHEQTASASTEDSPSV